MKQRKERFEYRHEKCGAVIVSEEERIEAGEDCPVCREVRAAQREYGIIRASAYTPLAEELGLRVLEGKVGLL